jgi:type II secretory pathway pseudopilin PulG
MQFSIRRAFTLRELITVLLCIVVLVILSSVAIPRWLHEKRRVRDATQLRGISQAFIVHSRAFQGLYPTPGLLNRLPVNGLGKIPGRGTEDVTQNTTANLFSMCIMANHISPDLCVGTTEPSTRMSILNDDSFDYAAYSPANNVLWDTNFKADLHVGSHVSYAHMPIAGERQARHWRDTLDNTHPILGNRGPLGGVHDPKSITNKIHRPYDKWTGVIVFSGNHTQMATTFPTLPRHGGGYQIAPECLPAGKNPPETDAAITVTKTMTKQGPIVQHD